MTLRACFLDVGQGDATVILLPENASGRNAIVVDCAFAQPVLQLLEDEGANRIVLLVLTHGDRDHTNGIMSIVDRYKGRIGTIALNYDKARQLVDTDSVYRRLIQSLIDSHKDGDFEQLRAATAGPFSEWALDVLPPSVQITLLYPEQVDLGQAILSEDPNLASCLIRLNYQGRSLLLAADLPAGAWRRLRDRGHDLTAQVLKFPHHGAAFNESEGISLDEFLALVSPEVAIFSVGTTNPYSHPNELIMGTLRRNGTRIVCTQLTSKCHSATSEMQAQILRRTDAWLSLGRSRLSPGQCPCAGSIAVDVDAEGLTVTPEALDHAKIIDRLDRPLCR